ncbi:MAG: Mov34/MPN/PAD-1 family protein [Candidatus Helarchaeota archaeon]|nr:Mov34/MPN/PAD-1 family protein [Candidatus Helarchaeota archaeon]
MSQNEIPTDDSAEAGTVIIQFQAYKDIVLHSTRFANPGINQNQWREVYGFLVGKIDDTNVIVHEAVPMVHGGATEVEFEEQHYIEAAEVNEKAAEKGYFLVGWYHSHPGLQIFLSSIDVKNHIGYQGINDKAIALVIDPSKISSTYSGFEIFKLDDPTNSNSSYSKLNWKIEGLDDKFVGQMLMDLAQRATIQRPLIDEYGERISGAIEASQTITKTETQKEDIGASSAALEMLEKALALGEREEYEKAIDLAISAGKEFEENGKIGLASDAFLQVGGFLYDFWNKISKIRTEIFTRQRDPSENDAKLMLKLALALSSAIKRIRSEKIGLILEIRDLSGNMIKVEDDRIQVSNILIEAAEIYGALIRHSLKQKNIDNQIKYSKEAANILSTALIFARTVKKQHKLLRQIINMNKIISEINFYHIRIQEIKAGESEKAAQYMQAAKLFVGGAKKGTEAAESLKDSVLASSLHGTAEMCLGKGYRSMGDHQKYIDRAPCVSAAYYNLACIHFEKAQRKFPVHALADIKNAEMLFQNCQDRMKKAEEDCKKLNRRPIDPTKIAEIESELIVTEPEPLFYP